MRKQRFITVAIFMMFACIAYAGPTVAQKDGNENVDEVIEGFEKDSPAGDELKNLMDGFEDESNTDPEKSLEEDDILKGFDEEAAEEIHTSSEKEKPSSWSLEGEFAFTTIYSFSPDAASPWRGFTMVRPELEMTLKNRFSDKWQGQIGVRGFYDTIYSLRGRNEYTREVLDNYESLIELKDTFIQGSLTNRLDTKIGRQIVVWGTLDNLRVTDVLNPLELWVPKLTDIDDLRLPVGMAKFDYYIDHWNLSAMAIPEVRFSRTPVFGSDFYPFSVPGPPEDVPDDGVENMQFAAALSGVFSGWDIGFYGANIYAEQTYAKKVSDEQFIREHPRINMLGAATNVAVGNWLFKAEAAWFDGLKYTNTPGVEYSRFDLGAGVEYTGFYETIVSLETACRHIIDYDSRLKQVPGEIRENEFQWALRITREFINDTLAITVIASSLGAMSNDGASGRLDAEYDITDSVSIRGGVVFFLSGDKERFQNIDDADRLFAVLAYNF
jgi:uncharacterized protein DUF1302